MEIMKIQDRKKDLNLVAFAIAAMFGSYWVYNCMIKKFIPVSASVKTIIGLICLYVIGMGSFVFITKDISINKIDKQPISPKTIILCFLLQFTAIVIMSIITNLFSVMGITKITTKIEATSLYTLFMLLVFNPIIEEFVFRKMFAKRLSRYGEGFYILVSCFCFAIVHGVSLGIPQIIYTFILGMIWSYLYVKTGNLVLVIIMHALSNFFGSVMVQTLMNISMIVVNIYFMLMILCGIVGFILFMANKKKISLDGEKGFIKIVVIKDMFSSVGIWCYVLLTLVMMIIT